MLKFTFTAAALALLLAGPATADDDWRDRYDRREHRYDRDDWRRHHDRRDHKHDRYCDHDRDRWRPIGHHYLDWRWRDDRYRDHGYRRHVPPVHYRTDFGYRSGYELAWQDWHRYGRYDRYWRRQRGFGAGYAYQSGYEAGWRDAASYYGHGYRPGYWAFDPGDGWYFSFHISG